MTRLAVVGPDEAPEHYLPGHPERPERVRAAMAGIADLRMDVLAVEPRLATIDEIARVHTPAYLDALAHAGPGRLDPDTYLCAGSWEAARRAAGAGLTAVDVVASKTADIVFVAARPPGHHARPERAMGFCLLNNIAIAAAALKANGERVLIMDWDVHHGNGTQEIFWDDPAVLFVSTHQYPFYPGTGAADETGGPNAEGLTVNIPLPAGATGDVMRAGIELAAVPTIEKFAPTWVLVSAGFDAHRADPLADLRLSAGDFAVMSSLVRETAPNMVMFLEGGYDFDAVRASVSAALGVFVGRPSSEAPTEGGPGMAGVRTIGSRRQAP
jgi:acetoin utilization deacetylase AcuC-like enzyme